MARKQKWWPMVQHMLLMLVGASSVLVYLDWHFDHQNKDIREMREVATTLYLPLLVLANLLRPLPQVRSRPMNAVSQAVAGAGVILLVGVGIAATAAWYAQTWDEWVAVVAITGLTVWLTRTVYRFAKRHEGEIGEARFRQTDATVTERVDSERFLQR